MNHLQTAFHQIQQAGLGAAALSLMQAAYQEGEKQAKVQGLFEDLLLTGHVEIDSITIIETNTDLPGTYTLYEEQDSHGHIRFLDHTALMRLLEQIA